MLTIDCIGPSWPRISSGTRSPIAPTMRPATGSHSLRQTGSVWVTHSARLHACAVRMPDGSADAGSSHRSARCSASATAARSAALIGGSPSADGASGGGPVKPGKFIAPAPVNEASATWRARSQLTGPSPAVVNSCCNWPRNCCIWAGSFGSGAGPPGRPKPKGMSGTFSRYAHGGARHPPRAFAYGGTQGVVPAQ